MDDILENQATQASTRKETDRKCPNCGGTMNYDPAVSMLHCPFCEYTEDVVKNEAPKSAIELDLASAHSRANCDWGMATKTVICKSCGAESVYDALQVSDVCPYCGSNQVMEAATVDTLAPNGVCPFAVTQKQAGENFTKWLKGKLFCPSKAKKSAKPDSFSGVYLPYWTFDSFTDSDYTARYGKDRTVRDSDGETRTVTDWYTTSGSYSEFINDMLVQGTTRHDPSLLGRIEPFNTEQNAAFRPEYLSGFASERYSIGLDAGWESGKSKMRSHLDSQITQLILRRHHADHVSGLSFQTTFSGVTYKYLLLPVWLSSFSFKGKLFQFLVNGQTGKVGGKSPVSALRVGIAVALGIAALVGLYFLFMR